LPRAAVSAEVYGLFNKKEDYKPKVISKSEEQIQRIKTKISQSFLFSNLEQKEIDIIIDAMEEKIFKQGETVIEQGQAGDCLYVVDYGELDCFKKIVNKIIFIFNRVEMTDWSRTMGQAMRLENWLFFTTAQGQLQSKLRQTALFGSWTEIHSTTLSKKLLKNKETNTNLS
jgi:hypothetical protein